jgi:hypothetical protein
MLERECQREHERGRAGGESGVGTGKGFHVRPSFLATFAAGAVRKGEYVPSSEGDVARGLSVLFTCST